MTRIEPIPDKAQLPSEQEHEWDAIFAERGRVRGPFAVMLHSPGLASGFLANLKGTHDGSVVSPALHELAILAVAYEDDAPYQWSVHVAGARAAGLSDAAIEVARAGADSSHLDDDERGVIELCRQLCRTNRVDQATFDALMARHGQRWLVLVIATIGLYRSVAAFNNAFEIDPVAGDDQLPARGSPL
ncbi:MAG: carboxymuconolactone decarboxylase family protein [Chloroflexi bacterium]|nr:carboxymuconolactone decarboxylase family protein [Chloroflexota bacterium]